MSKVCCSALAKAGWGLIIGALCLAGALSASAVPETQGGTGADKPNIIFVLTDDMSWGELGSSGNTLIQTPNLDRLYDQSLRFRNFHVAPYCAPTRAQLMSGRHEFYAGVTDTRYERGAYLRMVSKEDGSMTKELKLDGVPVPDGMSAANGKLFISLKNGSVSCY